MTIDLERLEQASERLQSSILLGQSWRPALASLAEAAGATAAMITRSTADRFYALGTPILDDAHREVLKGRTPQYSSDILILSPTDPGFVSDAAPKAQERLERIPFFRDYVKPVVGIPFRASASLAGPRDISGVRLSFWRNVKQGGYEKDDVERLDRVLPRLRAAAEFARYGFAQHVEEQALMFRQRGEFVFKIDFSGRLFEADAAAIAAHGSPLAISRGRLICETKPEQARLDAAIGRAISREPSSSTLFLTRRCDERRLFLMILPVCGEAVDVLAPASAIGVMIDPSRKTEQKKVAIGRLCDAIGLTNREAEIAGLITNGYSPHDIAGKIRIGEATVRTHLKSLMQKADVHSQVELAALVTRFE